jgi:chromosomal replication initiation ATPase DnaA
MTKNKDLINFFEDYCTKTETTIDQLLGKSRKRNLVDKRMILAYTLRRSLEMTYMQIAEIFNKDHASIIYYNRNVENFIDVYPYMKRLHETAEECLSKYKESLINFYKSPAKSLVRKREKLI